MLWNVPSSFIKYDYNEWIHIELTIDGQDWQLQAFDKNLQPLGSVAGVLKSNFCQFNHLALFNYSENDWPSGSGRLRNLQLSAVESETLSR